MSRRGRLAWGLVGALSILVLVQAYELAAGVRVGYAFKLTVALALVTVALAPLVERRFIANGSA